MAILYVLPQRFVIKLMAWYARRFFKKREYYKNVILTNLKFAYPEKTEEELFNFIDDISLEIARMFYDVVRLPHLTKKWIDEHVELENVEYFRSLHEKNIPIMFVTGHLGSFELLIFSCSHLLGNTISIIIRSFKNKFLDKFWNDVRTKCGSHIIRKNGAYREALREIKKGHDLGFPFDQNAKQSDAVFVDFFGKKAATTKTLAIIALRHHIPLIFAYIKRLENDRFIIKTKECDYEDIYNNDKLNHDEKVYELTSRAMKVFEGFVREFPAGWFWMHRRWKTRPEGEERFY